MAQNLSGATNPALSLANVQPPQAGAYFRPRQQSLTGSAFEHQRPTDGQRFPR